jgi:hypothetical protein
LQFFPDPARSLSEFRRVLRVGGRAAVCVVSTPDRAPMWGVLADALGRRLPDQREALHLSFALADAERLGRLLATHFRDVRVTRETRAGSFASFADYWEPIEAGTGQMPHARCPTRAAARSARRCRPDSQDSRPAAGS